MRRIRAIASIAAVWALAGAIAGAAHAMLLLYFAKPPGPLGISVSDFVWMMERGWATTLGVAGAGFGVSLSAWSRLSPHRASGQGWVVWGAVGAVVASTVTAVPRLAGLHLPVSMIVRAAATVSATAAIATLGAVIAAEIAARRAGQSLLRRGDRLDDRRA